MVALLTLVRSIKKTKFISTFQLIPTITSALNRHHHHLGPPPSVPKKVPFTVNAHGVSWEDPYHWMSNINDPDFFNYLHQENSYAEAFMADTKTLQQKLCSEMKCRTSPTISTPPACWGPWLYYENNPEGKEYPVLCRKLVDEKCWVKRMVNYVISGFLREEVLLDWNEIAEQYGYVSIGTCRVSPNHNFLAYTVDPTGSEHFILQVKDLLTGRIVPRFRVDGVLSLAWAQDGCTLFYTLTDENQRPYRVQCTNLESDIIEGVPIHTENDTRFTLDITSTKDGKFITVNSNSWTSSEVFVIDAANLKDGLQRVHKRVPNVRCFLEHHHGFFYILTNAPQCKGKKMQNESLYLARCRVEDRHLANWQRIIVPSEETSITDMDIFNEHLVLFLNSKDTGSEICSINMPIDSNFKEMDIQDVDPWYFPMPENTSSAVPGSNHDFMNSVYRVVLSTPVMPDIIVDYDMSRRTYSVFHQEEVVGFPANAGHGSSSPSHESEISSLVDTRSDKENDVKDDEFQRWSSISDSYSCKRKDVISHDGEMIPLTILFSKKAHQKGQSPGLLQGYGAYGDTVDKSWSADRLSLLDRGWVVAFADVRGGGGNDPSWHMSGKGLLKSNSIHDFVSCAEYLINEGYVHKCRLGALGASAGGLLVGAAINMYPHLFRAAILNVPFLDILNTLLDPSLPLTVSDYEEFGNPQIESEFRSILSYSPYDNIPQGVCLPAMLVTASYHDPRVGVWEAAKWVAKVREISCSDCSRSVILKTSMIGGHYREGGLHGHCEETAYEYAFLMKVIRNSDNDMISEH